MVSGAVVLRHLRLCAEPKCHALSVCDSSALVEDCEIAGARRGGWRWWALCGLDVVEWVMLRSFFDGF